MVSNGESNKLGTGMRWAAWRGMGWQTTVAGAHAPRAAVVLASVGAIVLLISGGALVRVPLPGTPVPMTLQTLAVLVAGLLFGPWRGALGVLAYLSLGAAGMNLFAVGFGGLTAGYLVGFLAAVVVVGLLAGWAGLSVWRHLLVCAIGTGVIFGAGVAWLAVGPVGEGLSGWGGLLACGFWPFLPGALLKIGLAAMIGAGRSRWSCAGVDS